MSLVLFDLDHTLLDGDSNSLWLDYLVEHALAPQERLQQQSDYLERYAAEQLDIAEYMRFHIGLLDTRPLAEWQPMLADFVESRIAPRISSAARDRVAEHRAEGHSMAIISATHSELTTAIAKLIDLPVIASQVEVRDGKVTGEIVGIPCFRETKLLRLASWLEDTAGDPAIPDESRFYSDSANDLPLLEAVRYPVAVNPDARLSAIAEQRQWPVEVWRHA